MIVKRWIALVLALSAGISLAQNTDLEKKLKTQNTEEFQGWKRGGIVGLTFNQASFSHWAAGGINSLSANGLLSIFADFKRGHSAWDNSFDLGYGLLDQGDESDWRKTDDKIELSSKYGRLAAGKWYYAVLMNFKTQMAAGYNYPNDSVKISDLMAPAYWLLGAGMDYKPDDNFNLFITPVTGRIIMVLNQDLADAGAFGVDPAEYDQNGARIKKGKKLRQEFGGYIKMSLKRDLMQNVALQTKLDFFSNYLKHPERIDINWEGLLSLKVNQYISTTISAQMIYDHDTKIGRDTNDDDIDDQFGPHLQFKEIIGLSFTYKF